MNPMPEAHWDHITKHSGLKTEEGKFRKAYDVPSLLIHRRQR